MKIVIKKAILKLTVILLILLVIYFIGNSYYKNRFLNNVYVNEVNVEGLTLDKSIKKLNNNDMWEELIVKSDSETFMKIKSEEIKYSIHNPDLQNLIDNQETKKWFMSFFNEVKYVTPTIAEFDKSKILVMLGDLKEMSYELTNAKSIYSENDGGFIITPESYKINLTKEAFYNLIVNSIENKEEVLNIEEYIIKPEIYADNVKLIESKNYANEMLKIELTYKFGDNIETVNKTQLKDWIKILGTELDIDEVQTRAFVVSLANKYDTYGKSKDFKTTDGKTIKTSGNNYGWLINRNKTVNDLFKHIRALESKTIEPIYSAKGVTRGNDIGNSYVEIDLNNQMVYVYSNGELKIKTPTVTGNVSKGHRTPKGVDTIKYKATNRTLKGPGYASPVKYWMPFNGGIGLHDADWRSNFGGDIYKTNGSHGCINLSSKIAKSVFDLVYTGMPVIVH